MDLSERYIQFAETISELVSLENRIYNKQMLMESIRRELKSEDNDGSCGVEFTGHAYKQISERLEELARKHPVINRDVFKEDSSDSLLYPSNLKSFVITLLSNAHKKGHYEKEASKNTEGVEYRYTIKMHKWSGEKMLQFIAIVEDSHIKTGFFNWV